jgi:hypothetical protein
LGALWRGRSNSEAGKPSLTRFLIKEDVRWFYIPVNEAGFVHLGNRGANRRCGAQEANNVGKGPRNLRKELAAWIDQDHNIPAVLKIQFDRRRRPVSAQSVFE